MQENEEFVKALKDVAIKLREDAGLRPILIDILNTLKKLSETTSRIEKFL